VARSVLPANQYNALRLFYIEGMIIDEVAVAMNSKVNSVKVWLHRARKKMARELNPRPSVP
jgi:DNA-directed RNA polymerase specialized sigma24 family protein